MGQGPVWGLQALRGLEGGRCVGPSQAQQPVLSPGSYRATHYEETACEHLWEPDELSGLGVHGNSISLASLVPSSSGCSETGAGVGAVGKALQGSPELADTPPPSIPQPQASGASSKVLQNIQGSGSSSGVRETRGSHGGGWGFVSNGDWGAVSSPHPAGFRVKASRTPQCSRDRGCQNLPGPRREEGGSDRTRKSKGSHVTAPSTGLRIA